MARLETLKSHSRKCLQSAAVDSMIKEFVFSVEIVCIEALTSG